MLAVSALPNYLATHERKWDADMNLINFKSNIQRKRFSTRLRGIFRGCQSLEKSAIRFLGSGVPM